MRTSFTNASAGVAPLVAVPPALASVQVYVSSLSGGPSLRPYCVPGGGAAACGDGAFAYLRSSSAPNGSSLSLSMEAQAGSVLTAWYLLDIGAPGVEAAAALAALSASDVVTLSTWRAGARVEVRNALPLLSASDFPDPRALTSRWVPLRLVLAQSGRHTISFTVRDVDGWPSALAMDAVSLCVLEPSATASRSRSASQTATRSATASHATSSPTPSPSPLRARFDAAGSVLVLRVGAGSGARRRPHKLVPAYFDAYASAPGARGGAQRLDSLALPCALSSEAFVEAAAAARGSVSGGLLNWPLETEGLPGRSLDGMYALTACYASQPADYTVTGADARLLVTLRQDGALASAPLGAPPAGLLTSAAMGAGYSGAFLASAGGGAAAVGLVSVGLPRTAAAGVTSPLLPFAAAAAAPPQGLALAAAPPTEEEVAVRNVRAAVLHAGRIYASTVALDYGASAVYSFALPAGAAPAARALAATRTTFRAGFSSDPAGLFGLVFEASWQGATMWVASVSTSYAGSRAVRTTLRSFGWLASEARAMATLDVSELTTAAGSRLTLPAWSLTGRQEASGFVLYGASRAALFRVQPYGGLRTVLAFAQPGTLFRGVVLPPLFQAPTARTPSRSPNATQAATTPTRTRTRTPRPKA